MTSVSKSTIRNCEKPENKTPALLLIFSPWHDINWGAEIELNFSECRNTASGKYSDCFLLPPAYSLSSAINTNAFPPYHWPARVQTLDRTTSSSGGSTAAVQRRRQQQSQSGTESADSGFVTAGAAPRRRAVCRCLVFLVLKNHN